jgi:YggT family protein
MREIAGWLDLLIGFLRQATVVVLVAFAAMALVVWLVRARHVSPFGAVSRFARRALEPMFAPFERRLVRFGIAGPNVPWWSLLVVLLVCATAIYLLGFLRDVFLSIYLASNAGPRGMIALVVRAVFSTLQLALLVRVVTGWIGGGYSAVGRLAFRLTEWFLAPLRNALPAMSGLDFSPLVAWLVLALVQRAFLSLL